jgi:hypothetical protein
MLLAWLSSRGVHFSSLNNDSAPVLDFHVKNFSKKKHLSFQKKIPKIKKVSSGFAYANKAAQPLICRGFCAG